MTYKWKVTFDKKQWYQLEWQDVDFNTFCHSGVYNCNSIEELNNFVLAKFPECKLQYHVTKHRR